EYVRKFSTDSTPGAATKLSQTSLSRALASCSEPGLLVFGARPYQTIKAHRAPADVPLMPTSSNRFLSSMSRRFFCSSMLLRISVRAPTSNAACIPPPWQAMATFLVMSRSHAHVGDLIVLAETRTVERVSCLGR